MALIQRKAFQYYETALADPRHVTVTRPEELAEMVQRVRAASMYAGDTETSGLRWDRDARVVGLAYAVPDAELGHRSYYVPCRHLTGEDQLSPEIVFRAAGEIHAERNKLGLYWFKKFDNHMMRKEGISLSLDHGEYYDVAIAAHLFDENSPLGLKDRAYIDLADKKAKVYEKEIDLENARLAKQAGMKKKEYIDQLGYSQIPIHLAGAYAGYDVEATLRLWQFYFEKNVPAYYGTRKPKAELSLWEIEQHLSDVLCDMEEKGVPLNAEYLHWLANTTQQAIDGLEKEIWDAIGIHRKCNLDSDDELRFLLTRHLGVELVKPTKGGQMAVDREVLDEIAEHLPVVHLISHRREARKIGTTYTESMVNRTDSRGLLHCEFRQLGTLTGRTSSANPNLQNIVSDSDDRAKKATGKKLKDGGKDPWSVKRAFCVRPGWRRWSFDFSQIELRVLAFYSRDPALVEAYLKDEDIHDRTSLLIFNDKEESHRRMAKVANFGTSYGLTAKGLSRRLSIPFSEAQAFYAKFYDAYPGIRRLQERLWRVMRQRQGCWFENAWGRTRRVPELLDPDKWIRLGAERKAISSLIQGLAADISKESMVRSHRALKKKGLETFMSLMIHDDLQFDGPPEEEREVLETVLGEMCRYPQLAPIPIRSGAKSTDTDWSEMHAVDLKALGLVA